MIALVAAAFRALQRLEKHLADRAMYETHVPFEGSYTPVTDWPMSVDWPQVSRANATRMGA